MAARWFSRKPSWSTPFKRQWRASGSSSNVQPPAGRGDDLSLNINADIGARMVEQPLMGRAVDSDGQQPVFKRVVAEDVGNFAADDGLDAVVEQGPRRMFARRAAAEITAGHQN